MSEPYDSRYRDKLTERAMELWRKHGPEYRSLLLAYKYNIDNKRELIKRKEMKKIPLNPINGDFLKEYPNIPIMKCYYPEEVKRKLRCMEPSGILEFIKQVEDFASSPLTKALRAKIFDIEFQIRNRNVEKKDWAMSAEACKGGRHVRRTRISCTGDVNSL